MGYSKYAGELDDIMTDVRTLQMSDAQSRVNYYQTHGVIRLDTFFIPYYTDVVGAKQPYMDGGHIVELKSNTAAHNFLELRRKRAL